MNQAWILGVLDDVARFALANGLPDTAASIAQCRTIAEGELDDLSWWSSAGTDTTQSSTTEGRGSIVGD